MQAVLQWMEQLRVVHFFRPPAGAQMMTSGAWLLPEQGGRVHVGITTCEKSPAFTVLAMTADKHHEVAALHQFILCQQL